MSLSGSGLICSCSLSCADQFIMHGVEETMCGMHTPSRVWIFKTVALD